MVVNQTFKNILKVLKIVYTIFKNGENSPHPHLFLKDLARKIKMLDER